MVSRDSYSQHAGNNLKTLLNFFENMNFQFTKNVAIHNTVNILI